MVQATLNLTNEADQILDIIKIKHNLKTKSEAINYIALEYVEDFLKPELRPEFIEKMRSRQQETTIKIKNFKDHFGLDA